MLNKIDLSAISKNLSQNENGIWIANNQREVSYPSDGNQVCFELEDSSFWFRHRNDVFSHLVKTYSPNNTITLFSTSVAVMAASRMRYRQKGPMSC